MPRLTVPHACNLLPCADAAPDDRLVQRQRIISAYRNILLLPKELHTPSLRHHRAQRKPKVQKKTGLLRFLLPTSSSLICCDYQCHICGIGYSRNKVRLRPIYVEGSKICSGTCGTSISNRCSCSCCTSCDCSSIRNIAG